MAGGSEAGGRKKRAWGGKTLETALADYIGLYVVMETIKIDKNRVAIKKLDAMDTAPPGITGGYIFKVDRVEMPDSGLNAGDGPSGLYNSAGPSGVRGLCAITAYPSRVAFHQPKEMELGPTQRNYLRDTVNAFASALAKGNGMYDTHIDTMSFIDQHILYLLSKNADGLRLSSFSYKDRGGKIVVGPIWDFDRSLECTTDSRCREPERWDGTNITNDYTNYFYFGWWRGLFDEEVAKLGKEAPARNATRWPQDAPSGGHSAEVMRMKSWVSRRLQWIGRCLAEADPMTCTVP